MFAAKEVPREVRTRINEILKEQTIIENQKIIKMTQMKTR